MTDSGHSYSRKQLFSRLNNSIKIVHTVLSKTYNPEEIDLIIENTIKEVDILYPQIPFIGGKNENIHLNDFFDSILVLALYKELKNRGSSARDVGQIMYEIREIQASKQSKFSRFLYSKMFFTFFIKNNIKKKNDKLNDQAYSENWKMEFVEGDGIEFDWGMDFKECAVKKFYEKHGGEDLLPYVCMSDYASFKYIKNIEFTRTQTMGGGGACCDFRFKKGGSTLSGWPPEERDDFIYNSK